MEIEMDIAELVVVRLKVFLSDYSGDRTCSQLDASCRIMVWQKTVNKLKAQ